MRLIEAYEKLHECPGQQYQLVVQHPQNWREKGEVAVFKCLDPEKTREREYRKGERLIGVFDNRISLEDFLEIVVACCKEYHFAKTRRDIVILVKSKTD